MSAQPAARPLPRPVRARRRPAPLRGASPARSPSTDFKLRFFGSALGYLWTLMRPLLLFGVLYVVFTEVVQLRRATSSTTRSTCSASIVLFTLLLGDHQPRRDLARRAREPAAQDPLPAPGDPALGGAARALQPRAEPDRRCSSSCSPRASSRASSWLELPLLVAMLVVLRDRRGDAAVGAVRALPRHRSRSGRWLLQILFYASPIIYVITTCPDSDRSSMADGQPARRDPHPDAPRVIDPTRRPRPTRSAAGSRLLIPLGIVVARLRARAAGSSSARRRGSPRTSEHATPDAARRGAARAARRARARARRAAPRAPTTRSPRPRTAPTGSTAGTST